MSITIELPETFDVTSRGETVTVDVAKLSADLVARAVLHGLKQRIGDSAAGAAKVAAASYDMTVEEVTASFMQDVVDTLHAGSWGIERGAGGGISARDRMARKIVGKWFRDAYAKGTAQRTKYDDADGAGRYAIIDKVWSDKVDAFGPLVDEAIEMEAAKAEKLAGIKLSL